MSATAPVSVVLLARDEEVLLAGCIASVGGWAAEVVVVDMESRDRTAAIAAELGAKVVPHEIIGNFDLARTAGIRAARCEWILIVDADEVPTPALLGTLGDIVREDRADVVFLPRANLSLSGFAPHEGGFPEMQMRMFRRSQVDVDGYTGKIHTVYRPLSGARILEVKGRFPHHCLLHYTNPALEPLWDKINRYTSEEARTRYPEAGFRMRPWHLWRPVKQFFRRYVKGGAWMDGWRGFWLCWINAVYNGLIVAKMWEMSLHGGKIPDAGMARALMREIVKERGGRE